jgi:hypothetical protein
MEMNIVNIKNFLPHTSVIIEIEFRAENDDLKRELIEKYKADNFSGTFIAEFIRGLSFSGENVTSEIRAGTLPPVPEWNGFDVLRSSKRS